VSLPVAPAAACCRCCLLLAAAAACCLLPLLLAACCRCCLLPLLLAAAAAACCCCCCLLAAAAAVHARGVSFFVHLNAIRLIYFFLSSRLAVRLLLASFSGITHFYTSCRTYLLLPGQVHVITGGSCCDAAEHLNSCRRNHSER
jgi:hypothetical protein